MRRIFVLVIFALFALVPLGRSAPIGGSSAKSYPIEDKAWSTLRAFRGGERAAVMAFASEHPDPVIHVRIAIFEASSNELIAEDKSESELTGNYAGVVWYPPRDGDYRIEVSHSGSAANSVYVAIK